MPIIGSRQLLPLFYERRITMIESYSINIAVGADANIPFNSTSLQKGCTVEKTGADTFQFNKCGIYMVSVDASSSASTTIQLVKDGVLQPQAQSTGTSLGFTTLVQVPENNTCCPCSVPTTIQVRNTTAVTFTNANIVITKVV